MYPLRNYAYNGSDAQMICSTRFLLQVPALGRPAFLCNPIFHGAESHPVRSERTFKFKNFAEAVACVVWVQWHALSFQREEALEGAVQLAPVSVTRSP